MVNSGPFDGTPNEEGLRKLKRPGLGTGAFQIRW
jgi:hypothetical protein